MDFILHIKDSAVLNTVKFNQAFNNLKDGKYLIRIDSFKKRTLNQNAYYHGVVVPMIKHGLNNIGYNEVRTNEDAHEVLKHLFLKRNIVNHNTGEVMATIAGSTANLKTVEFNSFLEDIWQWAKEYLNIHIPAPNEQTVLFDKPMIAHYEENLKCTIVN